MAVIHHTELKPSKLELLTEWLPSRPWYRGGVGAPEPAKAGGFRLDDPAGEVGIEFLVVTDTAGGEPVSYLVPLSYRGAPLEGADAALVGTMEHGVLGRRWAYDACQDPVAVAQLVALIEGLVRAQDQNESDTPDRELTVGSTRSALPGLPTVADSAAGTVLTWADGRSLLVVRELVAGSVVSDEATAYVEGAWRLGDGSRAEGLFVELRPADGA
ncbi:1,4-alpha-glucan branching protein [Kitasatospora sp. NPDC048365]|uniref:maltokinase N-terminal cap-like domain-containing protein n=1 Tax=Kitasatospora sp. NPDC048365 TaxID=3364050 RepID=UPI0037102CB7